MHPRIITAVNYNLTLRCLAETEEVLDIAYIWTHNGLRIRDRDLLANPRLRIDAGMLDIINATFADAGDYECIIKSAVGRISSRAHVIIEGPPGPPGGVQVASVVKTSATLRWTDGAFNGRPITMYTIGARTNWNHTWFILSESELLIFNAKQTALVNFLNEPFFYHFQTLPRPRSTDTTGENRQTSKEF